jgi:pimeloyl-ACP methyl ester carboxylesterase
MKASVLSHSTASSTDFRHGTAAANGVRLHYVEGGHGAPVLLLPGWPQSWYAWRHVMVRLAEAGRRVIAVDPRGMGYSERPATGYDLTTVAADIHAFAAGFGVLDQGPIDVAGHDVGAWIGYAYAADWPGDVRRLAVMDALVPGLSSPRSDLSPEEANLRAWHFAFNRLDDLPETLITGRERAFLTWLFRAKAVKPWAIGPDDIAEYARQLAAPGAIRAATRYYQEAFSADGVAANRARSLRPLAMPVLALGAERGVGPGLVEAMRSLALHVEGGVITDCGHYMPEESPEEVSAALIRFFDHAAKQQP